ncbi:MAG: D-glucuronyl C5-epimerase family protein [Planctomycetes bacterium]|nr:D-glucuronyl C5-epimerase family protein [Planctomycetota bacterium]
MAALVVLAVAALPTTFVVRKAMLLSSFDNDYTLPTVQDFYHLGACDLDSVSQRLDDEGICVYDYGGTLGVQRNPVTIAQFALCLVAHRNTEQARTLLFRNLDYLIGAAERTPRGNLVFPYTFDFPLCEQRAPWYSGMAQGQAASALAWGWRISGEEKYRTAARQAILALLENEYGFLQLLDRGVWLKEYPGYRGTVLDGSLAAIAGVWDVARTVDSADPESAMLHDLLRRCLLGFKSNAHRFDIPQSGHYFDDAGTLPTPGYHRANLAWLNYLSGCDPELAAIRERYQTAKTVTANLRPAAVYYVDQTFLRLGVTDREVRIR